MIKISLWEERDNYRFYGNCPNCKNEVKLSDHVLREGLIYGLCPYCQIECKKTRSALKESVKKARRKSLNQNITKVYVPYHAYCRFFQRRFGMSTFFKNKADVEALLTEAFKDGTVVCGDGHGGRVLAFSSFYFIFKAEKYNTGCNIYIASIFNGLLPEGIQRSIASGARKFNNKECGMRVKIVFDPKCRDIGEILAYQEQERLKALKV